MSKGIQHAMLFVSVVVLSSMMSQAYGAEGLLVTILCVIVIVFALLPRFSE